MLKHPSRDENNKRHKTSKSVKVILPHEERSYMGPTKVENQEKSFFKSIGLKQDYIKRLNRENMVAAKEKIIKDKLFLSVVKH